MARGTRTPARSGRFCASCDLETGSCSWEKRVDKSLSDRSIAEPLTTYDPPPTMPSPIPLSQPDITQREIDAVVDVLHTNTLSIGPRVEQFETAVAKISGRRHAIAVSSGTAGLHCAMIAAGIGPGDEVVTTPFSFVASANCVLYVGAKPVFVDIDIKTLNMDPAKVEAAITPKTKAIVAVEAFGHPGGMLEVEQIARRNELILIEDACEGF